MTSSADASSPLLRVAVVGSGPSGFYVVQPLLKAPDVNVAIDVFDRLPAPYGLVRYGVAPDHQKIKNVTKVYAKTAADPRVRFFGNVEIGRDLTLEDLKRHYHAIAFCSGAQTDRRLGIPGEDLEGSHPATEFVAWYNGHPDFRDLHFDLDCERAVVVGVGNVAIDVARILVRTPEELARTDVADYALEALRKSRIREVLLVGRRGPAQAAFTNSEVEEIGELEGADAVTLPDEVAIDDLSREELEKNPDRLTDAKVDVLRSYSAPREHPKPKRLVIRFLLSPVEIFGDADGKVRGVRMVKNELYRSDDGSLRPRPRDVFEEADCGLVFRSVGYRGVAVPGVPFHERWGVIPNEAGRIVEGPGGPAVRGLYVAGWIKRGPSGVIGTNRPDSLETANALLEDWRQRRTLEPAVPDPDAVPALLREKGVRSISFAEWERLDALEVERGEKLGRPRVKMTSVGEMLSALDAPAGV